MLLQIFEEGTITDSIGRKVDFRNTVIILTSNVGATMAVKQTNLGFGIKEEPSGSYDIMKEKTMVEAKAFFKPELLNRIDNVVVFKPLKKEELKKVVELESNQLIRRLKENKDIEVVLDESAKEFIAEKGFSTEYGARPIRRAVETYLEDSIAEELLKGQIKELDKVTSSCVDGKIVFIKKDIPVDLPVNKRNSSKKSKNPK